MNTNQPYQHWKRLLKNLGARCDSRGTFETFQKQYGESNRHYHTLQHISFCLREFLEVRELANNPNAVELAIWFHDCVYNTHRSNNEQRSAETASRFCANERLEESLSHIVSDMILATQYTIQRPTQTPDTLLFTDIDLSILGRPRDEFDIYECQIRKEYGWVPEETFRENRIKILKQFLDGPAIYQTEFFHKKYEESARENLTHSIQGLVAAT